MSARPESIGDAVQTRSEGDARPGADLGSRHPGSTAPKPEVTTPASGRLRRRHAGGQTIRGSIQSRIAPRRPKHVDLHTRRLGLGANDPLRRRLEVLRLRGRDVHEGLWISIHEREPTALDLDHDAVPATKDVVHVGHREGHGFDLSRHERLGLLEALAELPAERFAADELLVSREPDRRRPDVPPVVRRPRRPPACSDPADTRRSASRPSPNRSRSSRRTASVTPDRRARGPPRAAPSHTRAHRAGSRRSAGQRPCIPRASRATRSR